MMKIHLRTALGISDRFCFGEEGQHFQGVVEGNGAVPPLWMIITIFLVRFLHKKKSGNTVNHENIRSDCPYCSTISCGRQRSLCFNSGSDSEKDIVDKGQKLLNSWHEVLKVTNVDLKLSKCYCMLHEFQ